VVTIRRSVIDKIWEAHVVTELADDRSLVFLDRIFLHERSGSRALTSLSQNRRKPANPDLVFGTFDHILDTDPGRGDETKFKGGRDFITTFRERASEVGIRVFDIEDPRQGISHVVTPEQGIVLPGMTLVCGDSHTGTVGGLGALGWGIGSTEGEHALATQTIRLQRPKGMRIHVGGTLPWGVTAKDLVLHLGLTLGAGGAGGHTIEYCGSAISALSIEARLTLCNMSVELGASTGIVAPDDTVYEFVSGRPFAPKGRDWDRALLNWRSLKSDDDAEYETEISVDGSAIGTKVTWGTRPEHVTGFDGVVPHPSSVLDTATRESCERALAYMELTPGTRIADIVIDAAFIGSCTNSRIEDLRSAAQILAGRKVIEGVKAICVPGSSSVKREAEAEGLDKTFKEAGFEWRESGCSLCFWVGGDSFGSARRVVSSTNRNFENRQGPGVQTHLASPAAVAAAAVTGKLTDPRQLMRKLC